MVYLVRLTTATTALPPDAAPQGGLETTTVGCCPEQLQRQRQTSGDGGGWLLRVVKREVPEFPLEFYYMREARRRVAAAFRAGKIAFDVVRVYDQFVKARRCPREQ